MLPPYDLAVHSLEKMAEEEEAALKAMFDEQPEPTQGAVDRMVQDYLAWRDSRRTPATQP